MKTTTYQLQNVTKTYTERPVLQVDYLEIFQGEILALVGPSGAGKSTMLRLLNFLEPPTSGRILFQGSEFTANRPLPVHLRRRVTTVFQRPILLNRSVAANVQFGLRLRGFRDHNQLVAAALEEVGLQELTRQSARKLSGGEIQRIALARAIVLAPDVLLLDEPTANLDPHNVAIIEKIITRLNQKQGVTIVLVTHNIFQARRLAQRVGFMLNGRLLETAPTQTFFHNPKHAQTAAFIRGDMVY